MALQLFGSSFFGSTQHGQREGMGRAITQKPIMQAYTLLLPSTGGKDWPKPFPQVASLANGSHHLCHVRLNMCSSPTHLCYSEGKPNVKPPFLTPSSIIQFLLKPVDTFCRSTCIDCGENALSLQPFLGSEHRLLLSSLAPSILVMLPACGSFLAPIFWEAASPTPHFPGLFLLPVSIGF